MGVPEPFDPENGPVFSDLPYLPVGALAARLTDLIQQAHGLPMPWLATVDEPAQLLAVEFGKDERSIRDILTWATRFGGVLQSHLCDAMGGLMQHVTADFEFGGTAVCAFAFIPCDGGEDHLHDNRC